MTEIILASVVIGLVVSNIYVLGRYFDMTEKYMKAFMAKNLTELSTSAIIEKEEPAPKQEQFIEIGSADDSVFKKYLKHTEDGGQNELSEV